MYVSGEKILLKKRDQIIKKCFFFLANCVHMKRFVTTIFFCQSKERRMFFYHNFINFSVTLFLSPFCTFLRSSISNSSFRAIYNRLTLMQGIFFEPFLKIFFNFEHLFRLIYAYLEYITTNLPKIYPRSSGCWQVWVYIWLFLVHMFFSRLQPKPLGLLN